MPFEISKELFGLVGLLAGAGLTYLGTRFTAATNLRIAREKLAAENKVSNAASAAIMELLLDPNWELRSFATIKGHIKGLSDNELRQLLLGCGAICFRDRKSKQELWGLRERNAGSFKSQSLAVPSVLGGHSASATSAVAVSKFVPMVAAAADAPLPAPGPTTSGPEAGLQNRMGRKESPRKK